MTTQPASPFTAMQPLDAGATTQSGSGSSSDSSSASITASDFLDLLVTEMKNQDPTADTDPNEYINQLVQVNSLEQLIQINQDLGGSSSSGSSGSGSNSGGTGSVTRAPEARAGITSGNLSAGNSTPAASRIADALGTAAQTMAPGSSASPLDSVLRTLRSHAQQAQTAISNPAR